MNSTSKIKKVETPNSIGSFTLCKKTSGLANITKVNEESTVQDDLITGSIDKESSGTSIIF